MAKFDDYKEKFITAWQNFIKASDEEPEMGRERLVVFGVALILSFCFWLMINLSRNYNLNVNLPIEVGTVPEGKALAEPLPGNATASVSGEGWKLISLYNNPPVISVDITGNEVNVLNQVQQRMNALPDINVQKVQPLVVDVQLDDRVSKKVPLHPVFDISFKQQYGFVGKPELRPDSVIISGPQSLINDIETWETDSIRIANVSDDIIQEIELKQSNRLLTLSQTNVMLTAEVSQFTEGEASVPVESRGLPIGRNISYSPSSVTVKYRVPINEYNQIQGLELFNAYVDYNKIERDSSGFIAPDIEQLPNDYNIKVRSFTPRRVAYFMVLD